MMHNGLFRIDPKGGVNAYKTYGLHAPRQTHRRKARCEEVDCAAYKNGWMTTVDISIGLGIQQARYIQFHSGRHFTMEETPPLVKYTFPAGQQCFAEHEVLLEREPILVVRDGDFRGNPTGFKRIHANADEWIDDFANHQIQIAERYNRG